MIERIMTIEQPAGSSYKDKEVLDFELTVDNNLYTNLKGLHICFPIHFKKLSNTAADLDADIYPVNNFFAQWVNEIDILKYGTNKSLIPTSNPQEIYQYSDSMLVHLPKNALEMIQNNLLCSKKIVIIVECNDRPIDNNDKEVYRTDNNLEDRQDKFGANIQCSQILLTKSFRQYLEIIMLSSKV